MNTIFKTRKIPRHLIIYDEYQLRRRPKMKALRVLVPVVAVVVVASWAGLILAA